MLLTHGFYLCEDPHEQAVMRPYPPLGILYCSAYLKQRGFDVDLFDTTFSSLATFETYVRNGRPPVVGIYTNMMTKHAVLQMMDICRAAGCKVVLGGPEPVNYPAEYLAHGADAIVFGEGELALEELLPALRGQGGASALRSVPGIAFLDDGGRLAVTEVRPQIADLDALPWPDREAIAIDDYVEAWRRHHGAGSVSLITARGCPYRCRWCSHSVFGYSHRRRDPVDVADEIDHIREAYAPDMLWFADDVFTIHRRDFFGLATEMKRRGIRIPFETITREDRVNEDVARTLAEMGCWRIWLGAESGSQRVLDAMERRTDAARVPAVVRMLQQNGIEVGMFIMLGYIGEEWDDLVATADLLKAARPDVYLTTVAYPIKGTPYYADIEADIASPGLWSARTDRDLRVSGRESDEYYRHATAWLKAEVESERLAQSGAGPVPRFAAKARAVTSRARVELARDRPRRS